MKHFPHYWPFVRRVRRSTANSLHKGPVIRTFYVSFDVSLRKHLKQQQRGRWIKMSCWSLSMLSHSSLGWLHVFSSFPPPRAPPPPQLLLLLTSKPFELYLRYLGQRNCRSGEMYWMTPVWPWAKVMAVALINKYLFVCGIKWEPLN